MSKLLIIEDSQLIRKIINHLATSQLNCEFDFACDLAEAKGLIDNPGNDYFMALADLHLPDAPNGEVVKLTLDAGISTIVLTASLNEELRDKMLKMGVLDYIFKENRDSYVTAIKFVNTLLLNRDIKVIVADDSPSLRAYVSAQMSSLLYQVIEVEHGLAALQALKDNPEVGLLVTDYNMPEMNGIELIRSIRQERSREDFPIIGLSSLKDPTLSARFIKHGANDFLPTPFIQEEFQWRILKAMEQIMLIAEIRDAANRDYLTKLYNRRYFFHNGEDSFNQAVKDNSRLTVALLDIDYFKKINDNYGHDSGDAVLKLLAEKLRYWFKDMTVARYGGEEFIILIPGLSQEQTDKILNTFRVDIAESEFDTSKEVINLSVSIGAATRAADSKSLEAMINEADIALYQAKEAGRNQVVWQKN
ncbi:diguanylate cyclase [Psychrobium sp. 1_MG-2023]|uniref:GGDEF domain-containing response regulator n=1 Tax=Psychrobium sp. 1_MG-2023 TaxID=3062624 RepID=UPI002732E5D8|nr:diguanylate cyclase [Psychrobium sp. 1_MG-2023]MDP2559956.1 diguanylate cyclase [Psychrobium sp. 1_MG-2023]